MKLWFVIYLFGQVALSAGPLPDTMAECQQIKTEMEHTWDKTFAEKALNHDDDRVLNFKGRKVTRRDIRAACEMRDKEPYIKDSMLLP